MVQAVQAVQAAEGSLLQAKICLPESAVLE